MANCFHVEKICSCSDRCKAGQEQGAPLVKCVRTIIELEVGPVKGQRITLMERSALRRRGLERG